MRWALAHLTRSPHNSDSECIIDTIDALLTRLRRDPPTFPDRLRALLNAALSHTPRLVASALMTDPAESSPLISLTGTVLFADVDGFTALAERFAQLPAAEGVEELTDLINRVMAVLIEAAHRYGGDLLKFGGDAGLFVFDGEAHALRATLAAAEIHQTMAAEMQAVSTSLGPFSPQVAIGLATGRLALVSLGDAEGRELLVVGPVLAAMGAAQRLAPPGGTVLHVSTVAAAGDAGAVIPVEPGFARLDRVDPAVAERQTGRGLHAPLALPGRAGSASTSWMIDRLRALSPYLAPGLLPLLTSPASVDARALRSDRRLVTVLMTSLPKQAATFSRGLEAAPLDWHDPTSLSSFAEAANARFIAMRDAVRQYGGVLDKIAVGPVGPYAVVCFGAPTAHEDDPLRAILAAQALQSLSGDGLSIGINTGFVFAGDVGTDDRREYTVMGDVVNLAARLMVRCAPGAVWLGPDTADHPAVTGCLVLRREPAISLEGFSDPVHPAVVEGLQPGDGSPSRPVPSVVGRQAELGSLAASLDAVRSGKGTVVLIRGEPGVGKTTLIRAMRDRAAGDGVAVHLGAVPSYADHLPFAGWDRVLAAVLGLDGASGEQRSACLQAALARCEMAPWAALVAPIVGDDVPPSAEVLALPGELREMQRQSVVLALIREAARRHPRILVFDNAQWLSPASLALLDVLVDASIDDTPIGVWIVARDDAEICSRWRDQEHVVDLPLGPLAEAEVRQIIGSRREGAVLPEEVIAWAAANSGGFPMVAAEAVPALIESGRLRREGNVWALATSLSDFELPDRLYGLIQSRIDRLSPVDRHLLRAAAAVGQEVTLPMLVSAYGDETVSDVRRRLPRLAAFGLLPSGPSAELLIFHQPLVREVAYRGLTHRAQQQIHGRLTQHLDTMRELASPNWLTLVAHHAFRAHLWIRAVTANLALGRHAIRAFLAEQAVQALTQVLAAADAGSFEMPAVRFEAHTLLSETLTSQGCYEEARDHLSAARAIVDALSAGGEAGGGLTSAGAGGGRSVLDHPAPDTELDYREAIVLAAQGQYAEALAVVERGLARPETSGTAWAARLLLVGADLHRRLRAYTRARRWVRQALALTGTAVSEDPDLQQLRIRAMTMQALLASLARFDADPAS